MPIEIICKGCSRKLRVSDQHAGKHARCPQCGEINPIPSGAAEALVPREPFSRPADSGGATSPGSPFPAMPPAPAPIGSAPAPSPPASPFAWTPPPPSPAPNPFADRPADAGFDTAPSIKISTRKSPHRGPVILVFGILGFFVCIIFAIVAWIWGAEDLRKMRRGTMDPSGMGLTQAGMIMGMVSCGLAGLSFALFLVLMIIGMAQM